MAAAVELCVLPSPLFGLLGNRVPATAHVLLHTLTTAAVVQLLPAVCVGVYWQVQFK